MSEGVKHRAGFLPLLGLMYASACGGPYGMEHYVAETGPGLFLLLLFVTPWLWGLPTAFATAELTTRRSVAGGYYRWATEYLGEFWGYQEGFWNLLTSFLDNTLYPVLFADAIAHFVPGMTPVQHWLAAVGFIVVLTYLNHRGIQIAGASALALNVFLILPLIWLVVAAMSQLRFNPFTPLVSPSVDPVGRFGSALALAMWLYSGYYEVSAASDDIENPSRNIPLALFVLSPLVIASYALPTIAGLVAVGGWEGWTSGEFASIGASVGGSWLGSWLFLGSVASYSAIFLAYVLWWSRLVWAMAADGQLPAFLNKLHPRFGTPHRALWTYAAVYAALAALPFNDLLVADIWLTGASNAVLQQCLVKSRQVVPADAPGFRVPGGRVGLWLNVVLPFLTWVLALAFTARDHLLLGLTALVLPSLSWAATRRLRRQPQLG